MKKITKILSSVLAASMVLSCLAMNAFAVRQDRTYTVKASKTSGLVAGETITVEVIADTLLHASTAGYYLYFDPDVFTIDTASGGMGKPKKYIDYDWYKTIKDGEQVIGWYWGTQTTSNENATEGWLMYSWSGNTDAGAGVEAENNQTDYTIGKFYLKVKDGAPNGSTEITVDGKTSGWQETIADTMSYVPATLTVGEPAPEKAPASITAPTGALPKTEDYTYTTADGEFYNTGFDVSFKVTDGNYDVDGVEIKGTVTGDPQNRTEFSKKVELKTGIVAPEADKEAVNVRFALNIKDVPSAVAIALTSLTPYVLAN